MQLVNKRKRKFGVAPAIIHNLISRQAGSLGKAVLEAVMNSIDAGATAIDITIDPQTLTITDNGCGIQNFEQIEQWFETFGFDHSEPGNERVYGQFGIGRGQLWSFASTVWHTNQWVMDVDIKNEGLDYDLYEVPSDAYQGLKITAKLYETLSMPDLIRFEDELKALCKYCSVPVTLNGTVISTDPATEKWDLETDDAWIRIRESGPLRVYNIGVLVADYSGYRFGSSGVVVTKPGVQLALNMARNDVVVSECQVWKRIRPFLNQHSNARASSRKERLSEEELAAIVVSMKACEPVTELMREAKLITDIRGHSSTLESFFSRLHRHHCRLTCAPTGDGKGETAHRSKLAFVLAPKTLTRFGVETVSELVALLRLIPTRYQKADMHPLPYHGWSLDRTEVSDTLEGLKLGLSDTHKLVVQADYTAREHAAMQALGRINSELVVAIRNAGLVEKVERRRLELGESVSAVGWTDGQTYIVVERGFLAKLDAGVSGAQSLLNMLVHEYMHEGPDSGTHTHDLEFYEQYHNFTMDFDGHKYADLALKLVFFYLQAIHRAAGSVKARKAVIEQVDKLTDWLRIMSKTAEQLQELKVVEGSSSKPGVPRAA